MEMKHISVLLQETVDALGVRPGGIYADGTLGGGGHSLELAKRLEGGRLIAIDQDPFAHQMARKRLADYLEHITFVQDNFSNISAILKGLGIEQIQGIMLDLGVSSFQLDDGDRGFSYNYDAPLDMRMAPEGLTAAQVVNTYSHGQLARILREYGEEKFASRIASVICKVRETAPIETTFQLVEIIKTAIPAPARREGGHPAKRTFQAIRIEVNGELEILGKALEDAVGCLAPGGRIAVITFHSLEDRIVKTTFKKLATGCTCPPDFPICVCGGRPKIDLVTRKPILPSEEELENNSRSHSAKLRVAQRCEM